MKYNPIGALSLKDKSAVAEFCRSRNISAENIRKIIQTKKEALNVKTQEFSIKEMEKHLERFAPSWIDELLLLDDVLGFPEQNMLEYLGLINLADEKYDCTSWIVMPELTANGRLLFHKNRDSVGSEHAPLYFHTPGNFSWLGSCARNLPFPLMGINEKGLAVAMNSGEKCKYWNRSGFSTPMIARLMLEQCSTPDECHDLLEEMRKAGAYSHNNKGSIFFYSDAVCAGITEMCAERSQYMKFDFGYMIRANAWHLPGMTAMSENSSADVINYNVIREYMVREGLREAFANGGVTPQNCFAITRNRGRMLSKGQIPVCRPSTIATGTFEIDPEFHVLSTLYHASGPARNTIFIPIPLGAGALPEELVSGEWTNRAFKFRNSRGIDHVLVPQLEGIEEELCRRNCDAVEKARALLRKNKEKQALQLLKESTFSIFETADNAFSDITGF